MLIRMKLAVAKKSAAAKTPKFKSNWDLKDDDVVVSLYKDVVEVIKADMSLGLYNAYCLIFGEEVARYVGAKFNFTCPPQGLGR